MVPVTGKPFFAKATTLKSLKAVTFEAFVLSVFNHITD